MGTAAEKSGTLSIDKENLFSIIKKWLYTDQDIFFREMISNGCDAITKRKYLVAQGEDEMPENEPWLITVTLTPSAGTITFSDNGIGMTGEEVDLYINQIAVSGITSFTEKYKDMQAGEQLIGHFGLGFYSAFIEAEVVSFETLSYKKGARSVHWESDGSTEYFMSEGSRQTPGTDVTLYMSEEGMRYLNKGLAKQIIQKYCGYMPVEIYLVDTEEEDVETRDAVYDENGRIVEPAMAAKKAEGPVLVNNTEPFWKKDRTDCPDSEYISFYHEIFTDPLEPDPLFWVDLRMQEPFQLDGILYFPKLRDDTDSLEGVIKLYRNQVFVAENVKEVIPDYLILLKGVIDCPDFPLNVSRSAMQADATVRGISSTIGRMVTEKLVSLYQGNPDTHSNIWEDVNPVVKYGCLKNKEFRKKMLDRVFYRTTDGRYLTLDQYLEQESIPGNKTVYYADDQEQQQPYIDLLSQAGICVLSMEHVIDQPFIQLLEACKPGLIFNRVDADISNVFRVEVSDEEAAGLKDREQELTRIFRNISGNENLTVRLEKYRIGSISSILSFDEESRRLHDLIRDFNIKNISVADQVASGYEQEILTLNMANVLVKHILSDPHSELSQMLCGQLYDLALLNYDTASFDRTGSFTARSNRIMELYLEARSGKTDR